MSTINPNLTPQDYLNKLIVLKTLEYHNASKIPPLNTPEEIAAFFEKEEETDYFQDAKEDVRQGQFETGIEAPDSRHYEAREVGAEIDSVLIGWTYWYGGGKYGEPEALDWNPYFLKIEKEEMVVKRYYTKLT